MSGGSQALKNRRISGKPKQSGVRQRQAHTKERRRVCSFERNATFCPRNKAIWLCQWLRAHLLTPKMDETKTKWSDGHLLIQKMNETKTNWSGGHLLSQKMDETKTKWWRWISSSQDRRMKEWRRACPLERNAHVSLKKKTMWR